MSVLAKPQLQLPRWPTDIYFANTASNVGTGHCVLMQNAAGLRFFSLFPICLTRFVFGHAAGTDWSNGHYLCSQSSTADLMWLWTKSATGSAPYT